jgi:hypothetical protein
MDFWLEIEMWVIGKGGTRREGKKRGVGEEVWELLGFVALCVFKYISAIVVESAYVRDFRGTVGVYSWYSRLVSR